MPGVEAAVILSGGLRGVTRGYVEVPAAMHNFFASRGIRLTTKNATRYWSGSWKEPAP